MSDPLTILAVIIAILAFAIWRQWRAQQSALYWQAFRDAEARAKERERRLFP